jgi:hypothetical protein
MPVYYVHWVGNCCQPQVDNAIQEPPTAFRHIAVVDSKQSTHHVQNSVFQANCPQEIISRWMV